MIHLPTVDTKPTRDCRMYIKESVAEEELVNRCLLHDKKAQSDLYQTYSSRLFGTCLKYAKNATDAEDILQEGFIKIFRYLSYYRGEGSLEGWMRRIMINTSLNFYKRKNLFDKIIDFDDVHAVYPIEHEIIGKISHKELLTLVEELPDGYRTVFSLNIMSGYSHKEIGKIMNISVSTSKSQLSRAKSFLREKISSLLDIEQHRIRMVAVMN